MMKNEHAEGWRLNGRKSSTIYYNHHCVYDENVRQVHVLIYIYIYACMHIYAMLLWYGNALSRR
jgi:hypothetical protein